MDPQRSRVLRQVLPRDAYEHVCHVTTAIIPLGAIFTANKQYIVSRWVDQPSSTKTDQFSSALPTDTRRINSRSHRMPRDVGRE